MGTLFFIFLVIIAVIVVISSAFYDNSTQSETDYSLKIDFEDANRKKIEKMTDKLYDVWYKAHDYDSLDRALKQYEKTLDFAEEIRFFCECEGDGGALYYKEDIEPLVKRIIEEKENISAPIISTKTSGFKKWSQKIDDKTKKN